MGTQVLPSPSKGSRGVRRILTRGEGAYGPSGLLPPGSIGSSQRHVNAEGHKLHGDRNTARAGFGRGRPPSATPPPLLVLDLVVFEETEIDEEYGSEQQCLARWRQASREITTEIVRVCEQLLRDAFGGEAELL